MAGQKKRGCRDDDDRGILSRIGTNRLLLLLLFAAAIITGDLHETRIFEDKEKEAATAMPATGNNLFAAFPRIASDIYHGNSISLQRFQLGGPTAF